MANFNISVLFFFLKDHDWFDLLLYWWLHTLYENALAGFLLLVSYTVSIIFDMLNRRLNKLLIISHTEIINWEEHNLLYSSIQRFFNVADDLSSFAIGCHLLSTLFEMIVLTNHDIYSTVDVKSNRIWILLVCVAHLMMLWQAGTVNVQVY